MHEDLQKKNLLSEETSLKILQKRELHEVRQRTATVQCPQCSACLEEGFQFCKCGVGLKMDESIISRIRKRFQDVLGSSHYVPVTRSRGKKQGNEPYQVDHAKAKDTLRNVLQDRKYESILNFQKGSRCRERVKYLMAGTRRTGDTSTQRFGDSHGDGRVFESFRVSNRSLPRRQKSPHLCTLSKGARSIYFALST